ncbi:MAG: hypothetical protein BJ554DRAFT_7305 [Olpidium bornovanus]|uniref:Uncharacterized protein n=1 Tax=Olpidium bornovanus TaxID=278681 RepID=A0A8H7ZWV9_9FUNG|nr:MAG: hypothetical protein BJ554DRAFT_7305 [Olpidium bornovanus]
MPAGTLAMRPRRSRRTPFPLTPLPFPALRRHGRVSAGQFFVRAKLQVARAERTVTSFAASAPCSAPFARHFVPNLTMGAPPTVPPLPLTYSPRRLPPDGLETRAGMTCRNLFPHDRKHLVGCGSV